MNLQYNSEEPRQNYTSPLSEEREAAETLVPVCPERIRRIMRRVRPQSPIKKSIERVLGGESFDEKQFQRDVSRLQNPSATKWRWRMAASWILGNARLSEEQSLQAVTALGETVEKSQKRDRLRVWGRFVGGSFTCLFFLPMIVIEVASECGVYLPGVNIGVVVLNGLYGLPDGLRHLIRDYTLFLARGLSKIGLQPVHSMSGEGWMFAFSTMQSVLYYCIIGTMGLAPISLPLSLLLDKKRQTRVRREATLSLAQLGRVEALPYLLSAIRGAKGELHTEMLNAIGELLPRLASEHYGRFRSDTVPNLCHLLERCSGDYQLKALQVLGAIGDSRAIPAVRRLAGVFAKDRSLYTSISKTAIEILPILEAREAQENHSRNLLRASQEPLMEKELLRPSYAVNETEPEMLLRPSDAPPPRD